MALQGSGAVSAIAGAGNREPGAALHPPGGVVTRAGGALRRIAAAVLVALSAAVDRGGVRAAAMYTLIGTAKLNNVDPQAWLADVLGKIAGTPQSQLDELLPWNWQDNRRHDRAA